VLRQRRGTFYRLREEGRRSGGGGRQLTTIEVVMTLEGAVGEGKRGGGAVLFRWSGGLEVVSGKARDGKVALAEGCGGGLDETRGGRRPPPLGWADLGRSWANIKTNQS
jgi:hypothetical protein